ncbi:hypothetical protein XENOCAPTIV_026223 [Xenoophorus captivus]|uniref:Uncharacterized protein n=1 Tax=Xenoophorus captivus TaxID=1517983 RepID=A0ABV0RXV6_9TELE
MRAYVQHIACPSRGLSIILAGYLTTIFIQLLELTKIVQFSGTEQIFKHSPKVFCKVYVCAWVRPSQKLNISLLYPFQNQMCVWDHFPVRTPSYLQATTV